MTTASKSRPLESALVSPPAPGVLEANRALKRAWEVAQACTPSGDHLTDAASVLEELLRRSIRDYSEAPHDVYNAIFKRELLDDEIEGALEHSTLEALVDAMFRISMPHMDLFKVTPSDTLMALVVHPASVGRLYDGFVPKFKSEPIGRRVLARLEHLEPTRIRRLLNVYRGNPQSGITAAWIFEGLVHGVLCGQLPSDTLCAPLVAMQAEGDCTAPRFVAEQEPHPDTPHLRVRPRSYTVADLSEATFAYVPKHNIEDLSFVPKTIENPLFDSFFMELRTDLLTTVVWVFQTTPAITMPHCTITC